ncbi:hypothetical protein MP638_003261 [Amoeboaphelidium occidentale]|nr:hypothetical protein MP638_003261 [Amoeboaphelidium occidentale]
MSHTLDTITDNKLEELILQTFDKVAAIEDELHDIQQHQTEEELKIQHQFDLKRKPLYNKRNDIVKDIPSFWRIAMENHPVLQTYIDEQASVVLDALVGIDIERPDDNHKIYRIVFNFKENPYIENTTFVKEICGQKNIETGDDEIKVQSSKLKWKGDLKRKHGEDDKSGDEWKQDGFFEFLEGDDEDSIEIANLLISDFYPNVVTYYHGLGKEEFEDEDFEMQSSDGQEELTGQ